MSETIGGTTTKFLVDDHNPTGLPQVLDELVSGSVARSYAYGLQRMSENQLGGDLPPVFVHAIIRQFGPPGLRLRTA